MLHFGRKIIKENGLLNACARRYALPNADLACQEPPKMTNDFAVLDHARKSLISDVWKKQRMWSDCGHTNQETNREKLEIQSTENYPITTPL
jgi:hypothetical protein